MADTPRDYYRMLGVRSDATPEELKRAYRKLARELHPDVNPDPEAQDRFKAVTTAYEVLSDPEKRRIVDLGGDPLQQSAAGGGSNPFGFSGFGDVFEAFFGGGGPMGGGRGRRSRVRAGADALLQLSLTLEEAAFGVKREVVVETAVVCTDLHRDGLRARHPPAHLRDVRRRGRDPVGAALVPRPGDDDPRLLGVRRHRRADPGAVPDLWRRKDGSGPGVTKTIDVPAGIEDGMRIRLSGQGEVGPGGGPAGDLYIEIAEQPHETFTREGADLHCTIGVPMTSAALGSELILTTLDSEEKIDIRAGTQGGTILQLRARGVPKLRSSTRGDLYVHVEVRTPTRVDEEQERLLRELAALRDEDVSVTSKAGGIFGKVRDAFRQP